jgi:hypothetical protein
MCNIELIALRELAENKKTQKFVTPILEPVRTSFKNYLCF